MSKGINVTAIAERCDGWWAVEVPEIPGLFTQARRLDQIDGMVGDAAGLLGLEIGKVAIQPKLGEQDERMLSELLESEPYAAGNAHPSPSAPAKAIHIRFPSSDHHFTGHGVRTSPPLMTASIQGRRGVGCAAPHSYFTAISPSSPYSFQ
ncbi:hypothetical protein [Bifidobacterium moukalabense]|uniref:hypothetical protein n=1 Tax=Bifidobacterium moukalabense TaxID=1333651 RepID=UPI001BB1A1CC|nr:hypothetical protein [Bifidobacterium moukalabense]